MKSFLRFLRSLFGLEEGDLLTKEFDYKFMSNRWKELKDDYGHITEIPRTGVSKLIKRQNDDADLSADEVILIAENIRHYQNSDGGWGKRGHYRKEFSKEELKNIYQNNFFFDYSRGESDFDNNCTWGHIEYLAEAHYLTQDELFRDSIIDGVEYIVEAQHENGSWENKNHPHITFNDGVMPGVMQLLHKIIHNTDNRYDFLDELTGELDLQKVYDKGLNIILETQIVRDGELRIWAQQHDHDTLEPVWARSYEMPAYATSESVDVLEFLELHLSTNPDDDRVQESFDSAVDFLREIKQDDGRWARFHHLEDLRPIFADRDGIITYDIEDLGDERRYGYSWFNNSADKFI